MVLKKVVSSPVSRLFLPLAVFFLLMLPARPAAAGAQGLYHAAAGRQANGIVYLKMHETTSLRPDGSGEERLEFTVTNDSLTPVETAEFYFQVGSTDYWGIRAWDADGNLDYGVVVEDNYIHITIYYRDSVGLAEEYTYFFAINFPGLAQESGGQWEIDWVTSFPVVDFIRTINLPGGAEVVAVDPPPAEATVVNPVHFEWSGDAGVYYQVYVKDAEPEPDYVYQSNWLTANTLDLSIPDEGIGNLEWHVTCKAAPDAGTGNQSTVGHFVYDPFYLQKTRQAGDGTQ